MVEEKDSNLEQLREDFESRQSSLLPVDPRRFRFGAVAFLWKDDPGRRPGQWIAAALFLLLAAGIFSIPFLRDFEDGTVVALIVALRPLFISYKLFRDCFRRRKQPDHPVSADEPK
jgi:hypothetical protein